MAGADALERLLRVGSEWGSFASVAGGRGGARAVARELADETTERRARRGAKETDEWVKIYRAVEEEELENILKHRRFSTTVGAYVKHFTRSEEEAAAVARAMYQRTGKPYTIVYAVVRKRFVQELPNLPDVLPPIRRVVVPIEHLQNVRPRILPYAAIPWEWMR